jgi:hypothetical protein
VTGRLPLSWWVAVLVGCTPGPSVEPASLAGARTPGDAESLEPIDGAASLGLLTPVAFREGSIELAAGVDEGYALLEGEPIPLRVGEALTRDPALARGLLPDKRLFDSRHALVAFAGSPATGMVVSLGEHHERAASEYFAYARSSTTEWTPLELPGDAELPGYYRSLVATEDVVLGLRRLVVDGAAWDYEDEGDPAIRQALARQARAWAKAPRGFAVLLGAPAVVPSLPKGWDAGEAVMTGHGEVLALGHELRRHPTADDGPARLLRWAPGEATPSVAELPGLTDASIHDLGLWVGADTALVGGIHGGRPYLARDEGDGWIEVPLDLPTAPRERVGSATATDTGELWIVIGAHNCAGDRPCACLWRRPGDGAWELVELEPVTLFADAEPRWVHVLPEQRWIEVGAGSPPPRWPAARTLLWAGGGLWLTADAGPSYPTHDGSILADRRTLLYASAAVTVTPRELIATDRLYDERVDRRVTAANFTPGSDDCPTFTMRITDDPEGSGAARYQALLDHLAQLDAVSTLEGDADWASASMVYIGELDGRAQLVVEASSWNPRSAVALADGFAAILGHRVDLDCRPRAMLRPIKAWR